MCSFRRRETVQLSLGGLWQEVCTFGRTLSAPAHTHGREEVCVSSVRPALHAERSPDQARPAAHDHQEGLNVDLRSSWPQQNGRCQGTANQLLCSSQRTCTRLKLDKHVLGSTSHLRTASHWTLYHGRTQVTNKIQNGCYYPLKRGQKLTLHWIFKNTSLFILSLYRFFVYFCTSNVFSKHMHSFCQSLRIYSMISVTPHLYLYICIYNIYIWM